MKGAAVLRRVLAPVAAACGSGLASFGAWLAYRPAGFVVGGVLLLAMAWELNRAEAS